MLTDVYTTPGGCDEAVRIFLARDLSEAEGERFEVEDEEADMEQARVPVDELVRGVLAGELHNNCLVVGVLSLVGGRDGRRTRRAAPGRGAVAGPALRGLRRPQGPPDAVRCDHRLIRSGDLPAALRADRRRA